MILDIKRLPLMLKPTFLKLQMIVLDAQFACPCALLSIALSTNLFNFNLKSDIKINYFMNFRMVPKEIPHLIKRGLPGDVVTLVHALDSY